MLVSVLALALSIIEPVPSPTGPGVAAEPVDTKQDLGTVQTVDVRGGVLKCTTPAGLITYRVPPSVQVFSKEGKVIGGLEKVAVGMLVRVHSGTGRAATAEEIHLMQ
jgi:hypothetical protein